MVQLTYEYRVHKKDLQLKHTIGANMTPLLSLAPNTGKCKTLYNIKQESRGMGPSVLLSI